MVIMMMMMMMMIIMMMMLVMMMMNINRIIRIVKLLLSSLWFRSCDKMGLRILLI